MRNIKKHVDFQYLTNFLNTGKLKIVFPLLIKSDFWKGRHQYSEKAGIIKK